MAAHRANGPSPTRDGAKGPGERRLYAIVRGVLVPPRPPRSAFADAETEQLLAELRALDTPDLLALCLRFRRSPERLGLYLTIFRSRSGVRAQFAASLVCFDLARSGSEVAQHEVAMLAPTILELARDPKLVAELVGGDAYLEELWSACRTMLASEDNRLLWPSPQDDVEPIGEIALIGDEDVQLELEPPPGAEAPGAAEQRAFYAKALELHLGHDYAAGSFDLGHGFRTRTSGEVERLKSFLDSLDAWPTSPSARGLQSLGRLFLGTQLRRTTLFGKPNARRQSAVKAGLLGLPKDVEALAFGAGVFENEGPAVVEAFQKVSELLLDFLAFCAGEKLDPHEASTVERYVALNRQVPTVLKTGGGRRRV
jgi:hypothetical protein